MLTGSTRPGSSDFEPGVEWLWDQRIGGWRCEAIAYPAIRDDPRFRIARVNDAVPAWQRITWPKRALRPLRPDQQQAVTHWNQLGRGCVVMPTGTGKTEVALHLRAGTAISTLVVAPVREGEILHSGQRVFVPDFVFRHEDGRTLPLEIIGFWTPEYLQAKLATLRAFGHHSILLAVAEPLRRQLPDSLRDIVTCKSTLKVPEILARFA